MSRNRPRWPKGFRAN